MGGIVFGPLLGIGLAGIGGLGMPFLVLAGLLAVVTAGLVLSTGADLDAETLPPTPRAQRVQLPSWRPVIALLLLSAAAQVPTGLYDALWSRLLTDRGASSFLIGLSLTLFGLPIVALAPFGGRLAGRHGPLRVAGAALCIAAGFMASYGFVTVPLIILGLGVIEACFQAVAIPGSFAAVAEVFPDDWAATGQGWFSGAGTAAAGTAALIGAPAYGAFGPGAVFGGGALLSVALVAVAVFVGRGRYRRS
jgi:MFS family permease